MNKIEVLYVSDAFKQSVEFLEKLADNLDELKIEFKLDRKELSLETENYRVVCLPINSGRCGKSHCLVSYFVNATSITKDRFDVIIGCRLKTGTREIKARSELIKLLSEEYFRNDVGA